MIKEMLIGTGIFCGLALLIPKNVVDQVTATTTVSKTEFADLKNQLKLLNLKMGAKLQFGVVGKWVDIDIAPNQNPTNSLPIKGFCGVGNTLLESNDNEIECYDCFSALRE